MHAFHQILRVNIQNNAAAQCVSVSKVDFSELRKELVEMGCNLVDNLNASSIRFTGNKEPMLFNMHINLDAATIKEIASEEKSEVTTAAKQLLGIDLFPSAFCFGDLKERRNYLGGGFEYEGTDKFSQEIFSKTSKLTDDLILCAMKNAYEIGLLTAFYYINGRDKKHGLGSRIEIDNALSKLAESSKDYENPPPESAMCYSMRVPDSVNIQLKCSKCGKIFTMSVFEGEEDLISNYTNLAEEFNKLGHKAEVLSLCDNCAQRYFPSASSWSKNNIAFSFIAKGSDKPVFSYPSTMSYRDFEYRVALSFLKGSDTIDKLAEDTGTKLNSETYLKHIKEVLGSSMK